jgi:hypothetical protein
MGTERNAVATMEANEGFTRSLEVNGVHRARLCAFAAADTETFPHDHSAALSLRVGARGASDHARGWIAGQTGPRLKTGG